MHEQLHDVFRAGFDLPNPDACSTGDFSNMFESSAETNVVVTSDESSFQTPKSAQREFRTIPQVRRDPEDRRDVYDGDKGTSE